MEPIYVFSALHFVAASAERYVLYSKGGKTTPEFIGLENTNNHQPLLISQEVEAPFDNEFSKQIKHISDSFGFKEAIDKGRPKNHKSLDFHSFFVTKIISSQEEFLEYKKQFPDAGEISVPVSQKAEREVISKEEIYDYIFTKKNISKGRNQDFGDAELDSQIEEIKKVHSASAGLATAIENGAYKKYLSQGLWKEFSEAKATRRKDMFFHNKNGYITTHTDDFYKSKRLKEIKNTLSFAFDETKAETTYIDKNFEVKDEKPTRFARFKKILQFND